MLAVLGLVQSCSRVEMDKSVHHSALHVDLAVGLRWTSCSPLCSSCRPCSRVEMDKSVHHFAPHVDPAVGYCGRRN